jgi:uncharacterized oligopeptide transporter (OPT) family protein
MPFPDDFSDFFGAQSKLVKEYFETRLQLLKLQSALVVSRIFTLLIVLIIVGILFLFVLLFLGLSLAWYISEISGSKILGFSGAALAFFILMVLVIFLRKYILQNPLIRLFIHATTKDVADEHESF